MNPSASLSHAEAANPVLDELIAEITDKLQAGETVDVEAYAADHPDLADELRKLVPTLHVLAVAGGEPGSDGAATEQPREPSLTGTLGDFRILREIGRGGMGIVYEAEQVSLGRRVALKILPLASTLDPRHLQRFKNEAHAAAYLQHQNIVPVYFVGCDRGVHYYAMQYIDGHSLAEIIDQLRQERSGQALDPNVTAAYSPNPSSPAIDSEGTPVHADAEVTQAVQAETTAGSATPVTGLSQAAYFGWVARVGEQTSLALEHAHQQGVLHRDIKPANLLLDSRGNVWVTDFGLAHLPGDQRLTATGDLLGTLRYMSPEQALAQRVAVDHRTDIYSLGVTLYELLTLQPAYAGNDRRELLSQIAFKEPKPLRKIDKAIPAELETIVLKAMEKAPGDRYSMAHELAEDLHRYLADEPIRARRPSVVQRLRKWGRRHKPVLATAVVLLILAVIGQGIGSWLLWREKEQTRHEKEQTSLERDRVNRQRSRAERSLAIAYGVLDQLYMDVAENRLSRQARLTAEDKQFLERMRTLYEQVAEQGGDTPATRLRTAKAFRRVGDVHRLIGSSQKAVDAYAGAIRLLDELVTTDPASRECRTELAHAHLRKGECLALPDKSSRSVMEEFQAAARLFQALAADGSSSPGRDLDWAESELSMADGMYWFVPPKEGLAMLRHAEGLLINWSGPSAGQARAQELLARCRWSLGTYLTAPTEQAAKWRQAIQFYEKARARAPDQFHYTYGLHELRVRLAMLLAQNPALGPMDKAERVALDRLSGLVLSRLKDLAKQQPVVSHYRHLLVEHHKGMGLLLTAERNWPAAEKQYQSALALARGLEADSPDSEKASWRTGCILNNLACLHSDIALFGQADRRDQAAKKAVEYAEEALKHRCGNNCFESTLGDALYRAGRYRAALRPLLAQFELGGYWVEDWLDLAMAHWRLGDKAKAYCWYSLAEELIDMSGTPLSVFETPPSTRTIAMHKEAAALLGIPDAPRPVDPKDFTRQLQEMCHDAPTEFPAQIAQETPVDRLEMLYGVNALNSLAWWRVTSPTFPIRDPMRGVRLAEFAVMAMPWKGLYWNTLGVAHYRAGHWRQAIAVLARSMELQKGALEAFDTFFLAMAHWQLGEKEKARQWYERAVQWTETHRYQLQADEERTEELQRFRAEAAKLLGITTLFSPAEPAQAAGK